MAAKHEFRVIFWHRGREVGFFRWETTEAQAIEDAKKGFQWQYGYWPNDPIRVEGAVQ